MSERIENIKRYVMRRKKEYSDLQPEVEKSEQKIENLQRKERKNQLLLSFERK